MGGRCLGRRRRRGMALLVSVDALEHPVVMERRIGGAMEDRVGLQLVVLVVAAFDRCALLSIWKAERAEVQLEDLVM